MKVFFLIVMCFIAASTQSFAQPVLNQNRLYGVTIDDINRLDEIITSLKELPVKTTVRIVFDPAKPASFYKHAVNKLHREAFIMGELMDSYYIKNYSTERYEEITRKYVESFGNKN